MKIEAAVVREGSAEPRIETLDLQAPRVGEVLVRIKAVGVCHTDIRVAHTEGRFPRPIVLGHEGAGVVEAVGEGVTGVAAGDHVVLSYAYCGACPACRREAMAYCANSMALNFSGLRLDGTGPLSKGGERVFGFFGQSSFATHVVCDEKSVVKAPADAPFELIAPLGCGVQTGAGAIMNSFGVREGQTVAVFGAGSVGLSAIMAAKLAGASKIIAVDLIPARLALARELGADDAIDPTKDDPVGAIMEITGEGVDYAFNTTDVAPVYLQAIAALAPQGTFGFVTSPGQELAINMSHLMLGGRKIQGIVQGDSAPQQFIPRLIDAWRGGRFPLERLVEFYPFEAVAEAMAASEHGKTVKPVLYL